VNSFSIAELSNLSGIKAHTIRMWEQRYNALSPSRSAGNVRTYNDMDLRRLLNIVSLMNDGLKVSELCEMPDNRLNKLIGELYVSEIDEDPDRFVSQLIAAGMEFNEASFQNILSHCFLRFGVKNAYRRIIYPLLNRVGLMWAADVLPPAHEHFISNLIRQKLFTAIDSLTLPANEAKKWLLFLPENEYHEMGLIFSQYVLRQHGEKVFYLGASVPLHTISIACENINPDAILLFFVHNDLPENTHSYLLDLSRISGNATIYISGNKNLAGLLQLGKNMKWLPEIEDLERDLLENDV
jgi:DNA-binding transcriptional MerR regulator